MSVLDPLALSSSGALVGVDDAPGVGAPAAFFDPLGLSPESVTGEHLGYSVKEKQHTTGAQRGKSKDSNGVGGI